VDFDRNAAAVVGDADRAVEVQGDADLLAEAGHRLVGGVVDDFLDDVERVSVRVYMPGRCLTGSRPFSTGWRPRRTRRDSSWGRTVNSTWRRILGVRREPTVPVPLTQVTGIVSTLNEIHAGAVA
jgi:hypothetical protein